MNEGVVSKETVVLRRWGSSIQKFGFINGVDNVNWKDEFLFVVIFQIGTFNPHGINERFSFN